MENKRYAIVRVDNECPEYTEEDFECPFSNDKIECEICRKGRYGDTKEQLIQKVYQELTRQVYKNNFRLKDIATKIVEFLGVEE